MGSVDIYIFVDGLNVVEYSIVVCIGNIYNWCIVKGGDYGVKVGWVLFGEVDF